MREDEDAARSLLRNLKENGIRAWMDKESTDGGEIWRKVFSEQLTEARCCISIFSKRYRPDANRAFSQELAFAIQELQRGSFKLVPLRLEVCDIPNLPIGNGLGLADLHWIDLFGPHAEDTLAALLKTLGVDQPTVHFGPVPEIRFRALSSPSLSPYEVSVMADGRELCVVRQGDEVAAAVAAGTLTIYARVYSEWRDPASRAGEFGYNFGRSEKMTMQLRPFARYVVFIDARKLHSQTCTAFSIIGILGRKLLGIEEKIIVDDEETWPPTIQISLDRAYPE